MGNLEKRKIIFVIPNLARGGAEKIFVTLLDNLNTDKIEPICVFYDSKHFFSIPKNIKQYILNLPATKNYFLKLVRFILRILNLRKIINDLNPDVLFGFLTETNLVMIIARLFSKYKPKLIISEYTLPSLHMKYRPDLRFLMSLFYRISDNIIAISNGVKKDLIENFGIKEEKISVIYNPINETEIKSKSEEEITEHVWFKENKPIIINVASLTKLKGHEYLINVFEIIRKKLDCRLVILGDGDEKERLINLVNSKNLEKNVLFLNFQENPYKFMAHSSVFVLSSLYEGRPNVLIEAILCGIPVVSTDCPCGPREIIFDGVDGLLVPMKDENKLAEAVLKILNNKKFAGELILNAKNKLKEFSLQKSISKYEEILTK
ncbi:MAG: glycosyltransferase [Elusimicrobia bacterium]|nr:glycosyltransferase [Elusimicrobiota bacterium]